jgi:hypothetical protein
MLLLPHAPPTTASAGGNAQDNPNAGAANHPRRPAMLLPSLSSTAAWPSGTAPGRR